MEKGNPANAFDAALHALAPHAVSRPQRPDDAGFAEALFVACSPLRGVVAAELVQQQAAYQRDAHLAAHPAAMQRIIERYGQPVARIVIDWSGSAFTHGIDIAVLPEQRKGAIGLRMLQAWLVVADAIGRPCRLSVLSDNRARRVYERPGFRTVAGTDDSFASLEMVRPLPVRGLAR